MVVSSTPANRLLPVIERLLAVFDDIGATKPTVNAGISTVPFKPIRVCRPVLNWTRAVAWKLPGAMDPSLTVGRVAPCRLYWNVPDVGMLAVGTPTR